jgi:hypothetical protein
VAKREKAAALLRGRRRHSFLEALPKHAVVAEIGVLRGEFTRHILRVAQPRELHLIDVWWELYGERFPDWGSETHRGTLSTKAAFDAVTAMADGYERAGRGHCSVHVGDDREVLAQFADGHFDWVYLDSSHDYEHTRQELELLRVKVKRDGLITGHDWYDDPQHPHYGVRRAIEEFCAGHGWELRRRDAFAQWAIGPPGR